MSYISQLCSKLSNVAALKTQRVANTIRKPRGGELLVSDTCDALVSHPSDYLLGGVSLILILKLICSLFLDAFVKNRINSSLKCEI